jgi:hypothetical protein
LETLGDISRQTRRAAAGAARRKQAEGSDCVAAKMPARAPVILMSVHLIFPGAPRQGNIEKNTWRLGGKRLVRGEMSAWTDAAGGVRSSAVKRKPQKETYEYR